MIRCVIFDLGKVIVPFDLQRGYAELQKHCPYPAEQIPRRIGGTDLVRRFETGLVSSEDFVRELSALLGLTVNYGEFCRLWSSIFLPQELVPASLLEALKSRYRLLLLSNTNALHFAMVKENYPILRHFDDLILSYEVGAMKPDPRIYAEAVRRSGCTADECLFIDDIAEYAEGARRAGLEAIQFRGVEQLEQDLRAHGVEWGQGFGAAGPKVSCTDGV